MLDGLNRVANLVAIDCERRSKHRPLPVAILDRKASPSPVARIDETPDSRVKKISSPTMKMIRRTEKNAGGSFCLKNDADSTDH